MKRIERLKTEARLAALHTGHEPGRFRTFPNSIDISGNMFSETCPFKS